MLKLTQLLSPPRHHVSCTTSLCARRSAHTLENSLTRRAPERRRRLRLAILHAEAGELQRGLDILKESSLRELKAWAGELQRAASRKADS